MHKPTSPGAVAHRLHDRISLGFDFELAAILRAIPAGDQATAKGCHRELMKHLHEIMVTAYLLGFPEPAPVEVEWMKGGRYAPAVVNPVHAWCEHLKVFCRAKVLEAKATPAGDLTVSEFARMAEADTGVVSRWAREGLALTVENARARRPDRRRRGRNAQESSEAVQRKFTTPEQANPNPRRNR